MIHQRNISKLANRLYQETVGKVGKKLARRVPENVIERDYVLAWFLTELAMHPLLSTALAFKGGTALRRVHFGEYRFSEDLDFSLTRAIPLEDLFTAFRQVFVSLEKASGISFTLDAENVTRHQRNDTFYFGYKGPLPAKNSVKVDVTRGETIVFPLDQKRVLKTYPEYTDLPEDGPTLQVYAFYEIVVEKTLAITDGARREPRDLYDLWYILQERHVEHPEELVEGLSQKLASRDGRAADVLAPRLERVEGALRKAWEQRLGMQVEILPGFDDCFRDVKKLMSDFDKLRGMAS
ncbi:MAG: nucleotidyl transferase AbiEii/AbiGii toxin family protein [Oxalobacteraceae bacterium]